MPFIAEPISVSFEGQAGFEKRPECPSTFVWRGETHVILECLNEWRDYGRRGKMAHNMRPSHLAAAEKRGSRGVGRHYFRVRTDAGRVFEIYYDRAPKDTRDTKGSWHLFREVAAADG